MRGKSFEHGSADDVAVRRRLARRFGGVCVPTPVLTLRCGRMQVRRGGGKGSLSDDTTKDKFEAFVQSIVSSGGSAQALLADGTG